MHQARAKNPVVDVPPRRDRLLVDMLQQSSQELLLALMMPGIEPHRTKAGFFQVATKKRHHGTLAGTPHTFDREGYGGLRRGVSNESRQAKRHRGESE